MRRTILIAIAAFLVHGTAIVAQTDTLQISAELRPRTIFDHGYKTPGIKGENSVIYTTQRTRLNALFINQNFETFLSMQDVRIWGDDNNFNSSGTYGNSESTGLNQAWVKYRITESLWLKAGRQVLSYDDQRIISARNWNDYQVTYDALLAGYQKGNSRFNIVLSFNADNKTVASLPEEKFKTFDLIHYQYKIENFSLSGLAVLTGNTVNDSSSLVNYRATLGTNANIFLNRGNARLSFYYQRNLNNTDTRISSFLFSLYTERELTNQISLGLGMDYLSGNDDHSPQDKDRRFDILYGGRHGFYGIMDYYSKMPPQGLQDYMIKLRYSSRKGVSLNVDLHYFMLSADKYDYNDPSKKLHPGLGQELDFILKWKISQIAQLETGYSLYRTTNTLEQLKGQIDNSRKIAGFGYIMLSVRPSWLL